MAPMLSVILPVFNVDRYLLLCLDSIMEQAFTDIEVIAVDGGSIDRSPEILAKKAVEDPRLHVETAGRIGPGRARNVGAECATGEYLWFVDGDDTLAPGSIGVIARRIRELRPDVLLLGWEAIYPDGRRRLGDACGSLSQAPGTCFPVIQETRVIAQTMASWAKIFRREYFTSSGVSFAEKWPHEDVPVSCLLLAGTDRVAVLPEVCYLYRRNRPGSLMEETDKHFNIFNSYRLVLEDMEKRLGPGDSPIPAEVYKAFFERAIWHYSTILDQGHALGPLLGKNRLVPVRLRRSFFTNMHWDFARYRPHDYRCHGGVRGLKMRLIERNAYRAYSLLTPANKLRVVMTQAAGRVRGKRARPARPGE